MRARIVLMMVLASIGAVAASNAMSSEQAAVQSGKARSLGTNPGKATVIEVIDGRLTLAVTRVPLARILSAIGSASGTSIVVAGQTDETVTDDFRDVPMDQGLRRILRGRSSAFVYSAASSATAESALPLLERVYVLTSGGRGSRSMRAGSMAARGVSAAGSGRQPNFGATGATRELGTPLGTDALRNPTAEDATSVEVATTAAAQSLIEATSDAGARKEAAETLGQEADAAAIEPLSHTVLNDVEPSVRETAAEALGRTWNESAVEALDRALREDDDVLVRGAAARALGETWSDEAVGPLARALLEDPSRQVRADAAVALHRIGSVDAVEPLILALDDDDLAVRETVTLALRAIGGPLAESALAGTMR